MIKTSPFVLALCTVTMSMFLASPTTAQIPTAAALLDQCTNEALSNRENCAAYILQSIDRNRSAPEPAYCLPAGAILGDLRARFITWGLVQTPAALAAPADDGLAAALAEAFPCPLIQSG